MTDHNHPRCGCGGEPEYNCSPDDAHWIECCKCGTSTGVGEDGAHAWELWFRAMSHPALADLRERCARVADAHADAEQRYADAHPGYSDSGMAAQERASEARFIAAEIRALPLAPEEGRG